MPSLLEIERAIDALLEAAEDTAETAETPEERAEIEAGIFAALDAMAEEEKEKVDAYGCLKSKLEAEEARLAAIIQELTTRKQYVTNKLVRLKNHVAVAFEFTGRKKIEGNAFIARARQSSSLNVYDASKIPAWLTRVKVEPNKEQIKAEIKSGMIVPGAEIVTRTSVSIGVA